MATAKPLISYCTTCKGRLHQLRETLPANLAAEKDNPNVEFVVLDYDSVDKLPDGISRPEDGARLGAWVKETFPQELASGRLRYARLDERKDWEYAHAKNMAHRVATGDILCNVDADNFIAPNFSRWLSDVFTKNPSTVATVCEVLPKTLFQRRVTNRLLGIKGPPSGTAGRVAISSDDFYRLNGYDERYSAYMGDDVNLVARARDAKLDVAIIPREYYGTAIKHANDLRTEMLSDEDKERSHTIIHLSKWQSHKRVVSHTILKPDPIVNTNGHVGCGKVTINFGDAPTPIKPLQAAPALQETITMATAGQPARRTDWVQTRALGDHPQIQPRTR